LLYLAIIGVVFYAVITIVNQNVEIAEKRSELQQLQQQINVVEIQSQYLEKVQSYEGEELEEYIEKIAKEDLGYVSEGERIFINVAGD
jgi:cell division protein DivIC